MHKSQKYITTHSGRAGEGAKRFRGIFNPLQFRLVLLLTLFKVCTLLQLLPNIGRNFFSYKIVLGSHFLEGASAHPIMPGPQSLP